MLAPPPNLVIRPLQQRPNMAMSIHGCLETTALALGMGIYHPQEIAFVPGTSPLRVNASVDLPEAGSEKAMMHARAGFAKHCLALLSPMLNSFSQSCFPQHC